MKNKIKGSLALAMAFSLAFSSMSVNSFADINNFAIEASESVENSFKFGSSEISLAEGIYKLPISMMKSSDITASSMAGGCIKSAYLTVEKTGKAKIKINLQPVSMGAISSLASDWKIYSNGLDSALNDAEYTTDTDGKVDSIAFEVTDITSDGVYANMFIDVMSMTQDCYLKLDYKNAEKVFAFGSEKHYLSAGSYEITAKLKNSSNIKNDSMAASCIKGARLNINKNGDAEIKLDLQAVSVGSIVGWGSQWKIYSDGLGSSTTDAQYTTDSDGNVDSITYALKDNSVDGTYINMYISVMGYAPDAYVEYDFSSAVEVEKGYNGTFHISQFGEYDINAVVYVKNNVITRLEVEGANFNGAYADFNKAKLESAISGMTEKIVGKNASGAKEIYELDTVSGATYSSKGIKNAVMSALSLEYDNEDITLPNAKLEEGEYKVDISFYTDNVLHYLTENEKVSAKIKADEKGNMVLITDIINGTAKEPLYLTEFNGYYTDNDIEKPLITEDMTSTKEAISFSDEYFEEGTKVITKVQMPLVGDFAKIYNSNAHIYVPAMNKLNGEVGGVQFTNGWFDTDCFLKVYWDSLEKIENSSENKKGFGSAETELSEGRYTVPLSMKNASDITSNSMAASCIKGAELEVKADGSGEITVDLQAVSVTMGGNTITSWAKDWKYYEGTTTSAKLVNMEETKDENGNVVKAKFKIPDNSQDGVYVNMNSGRNASDAYFAIDYKNARKITKGFGSAETELSEGRYTVPLSMKNASDITSNSMAASCIKGAELEVKADGSGEITVDLQAVSVTMGGHTITSWAKDWKYYEGTTTSAILIDMEETKDENGNVVKAKFKIPDNSQDGVYVNMNSGRNASDAYFAIDYKNAKKKADGFSFGSENTILKAGKYKVSVDMKNASNLSQGSMAANCLNGAVLEVDENGKAKLTIGLKAVKIGSLEDWAEQWKLYADGIGSELIEANYTLNADGKVNSITFDILDNSKDGAYIQMYVSAMGRAADAYLVIDYKNAEKVREIIYGDVDCNGKVEKADADLILKYVLNPDETRLSEEGLANAKVSGSELITATDSAMIMLKIKNSDYKFPVEK